LIDHADHLGRARAWGARPQPPGAITQLKRRLKQSRTELFHSHGLTDYYDLNAQEEHVELKRSTGNPQGTTGMSMLMILMYR